MARSHTVVFLLLFQVLRIFHPTLAVSDRADPNNPPTSYEDCIQQCEADTDVSCINCGLENVPTSTPCRGATTLELKSNSITDLRPGVFSGFDALKILVLSDNGIQDIPLGVFRDLRNLDALYIEGNNLTGLRRGVFEGLDSMSDRLLLTGNQITRISTGVFSKLGLTNILAVDNNHIESIQPGAFRGMTELSLLLLGKNRLSTIASGTFSGLGKLRKLDLSFNRIEILQTGAFEGLPSLEELNLNSNRITSLAAIENLPQWYTKHDSTDAQKPTCIAPAEYADKSLSDIQEPLLCKAPAEGSTGNPLMEAPDPDQSKGLLGTPESVVVVVIVVVVIITLVIGVHVWRKHQSKRRIEREAAAANDQEAPDTTPEARGYSTFVDPAGASETLINQTTVPHSPPNANAHIFRETEQDHDEAMSMYLPTEELNHSLRSMEPRQPATVAPRPTVSSPVSSPMSSLEPDVSCWVDFDHQGSVVITTPEPVPDESSLYPTDQCNRGPPPEVIYAKLDHSSPTLSESRPGDRGYISPMDLV